MTDGISRHLVLGLIDPYNAEIVCINYGDQSFFQLEIIINVSAFSALFEYLIVMGLWSMVIKFF